MNTRNPSVFARPFSDDRDGNVSHGYDAQDGITLREEAALRAFQAIISASDLGYEAPKKAAELAFRYADAFIAEYNRPGDEQRAKWAAEREAGRKLVATARYIIGGDHRIQLGSNIVNVEYVWDRHDKALVAAQQRVESDDPDAQPQWEPIRISTPATMILNGISERMAKLEDSILREQPSDLEEWGFEATNELPAWAQPK